MRLRAWSTARSVTSDEAPSAIAAASRDRLPNSEASSAALQSPSQTAFAPFRVRSATAVPVSPMAGVLSISSPFLPFSNRPRRPAPRATKLSASAVSVPPPPALRW
jgi:hypothetical protein